MTKTSILRCILAMLLTYSLNGLAQSCDVNPTTSSNIDELSPLPVNTRVLGTAYNIYTALLNSNNQVSYDPVSGAISYTHRQDNLTPGGSGGLSFDVSFDGGGTWTTNQIMTPDYNDGIALGVSGCRYPNGVIFNPLSSTNPDSILMVANGPALTLAIGWGNQFRLLNNLSGSVIAENYGSNSVDQRDFHPYSLVNAANGHLWSLSTRYTDGISPDDYELYDINKGTYNPLTQRVDWTFESIASAPYFDGDGLPIGYGFSWGIDFDPTGQIGYLYYIGSDTSISTAGVFPIIYKSTDAGATWNKLPVFDFSEGLFEFDYFPTTDSIANPFFVDVDLTVDINGELHLFSLIIPNILSGFGTPLVDDQFLFALSTSNGIDWDVELIDSVRTDDGTVGSVAVTSHPQIARNQAGDKIFYAWCDSDPDLTSTNDLPNVFAKSRDVNTETLTGKRNLTALSIKSETGYYPKIAPIIKEDGAFVDYEIPLVIAEPGFSDLDPAQFWYIQGAGFNDADYQEISLTLNSSPVLCNGDSTGVVNATVVGGVPPYNFDWSHDASLNDSLATALAAGNYTLTVTDMLGTSASASISVEEPEALTVTEIKIAATDSFSTDGSISLWLDGCSPPFTYLWNTADTSQNLEGIGLGVYSVTIMDASSCVSSFSYELGPCSIPSGLASTPGFTEVGLDWDPVDEALGYRLSGRKSATGSSLKRFNVSSDSYLFSGLATATLYEWTVESICAESYSQPAAIQSFSTFGLREESKGELSIFPNPAEDVVYLSAPAPAGEIQIQITDLSGKTIIAEQLSNSNSSISIENLSKGAYLLKAFWLDSNGNSRSQTETLIKH